jgi:hypothetical protein
MDRRWAAYRLARARPKRRRGVCFNPDPIPVGTVIQMLFSLPEGEIRVQGTVRFSAKGRGFGVEFTKFGPSDRARLLDLLRRLNGTR